MAESILSESLPAEVNDRTWGLLTALNKSAKQRAQGPHIFLTGPEHFLGRAVRDPRFSFDSPSVSGVHCRIFRKQVADEGIGVFIKDTSSNGTYVNWQKLRKDGPEHRIQHGDIISLASPAEQAAEVGFAYVFRDTSSGCLKRKQEDETGKPDDTKRMRVAADGPVSLTDVRRLERSNQELRQRLETESSKNEELTAELRAAKAATDNLVKEAVDHCQAEHQEKMGKLQAQLTTKASTSNEYSDKCVQLESTIDDLNKRLKAAGQSRMEAEEALKNIKANREELEKQIERERSQWKRERDEAEVMHNGVIEKLRAEASENLKRQADAHSRQLKQLEDELAEQQESKEVCRAQVDSLKDTLEVEREIRMDSEHKAQELQILYNNEQRTSSALAEEMKLLRIELEKANENYSLCQMEKDAANSKLCAAQEAKDDVVSKLKLEKQRLDGAKDRIVLRETQLRAFQSTAEAIAELQKKQQEQLNAMIKTLADDDAEYANAVGNCDDEADDKADVRDVDMTQPNGLRDMEDGYPETQVEDFAQTLPVAATQIVATQIDATQVDATQAMAFAATQPQDGDDLLVPKTESADEPEAGARDAAVAARLTEAGSGAQLASASQRSIGRARSLHTVDLRASETLGSWVNETPPVEGLDEMAVEQPEAGVAPESQVGNSDSLPARRLNDRIFNNTMASQSAPRFNMNDAAPDSGSDTEEE